MDFWAAQQITCQSDEVGDVNTKGLDFSTVFFNELVRIIFHKRIKNEVVCSTLEFNKFQLDIFCLEKKQVQKGCQLWLQKNLILD